MTKPIQIVSQESYFFEKQYGISNFPPPMSSPPNKKYLKNIVFQIVENKKSIKDYYKNY